MWTTGTHICYPNSADVPEAVAANVRRRSFTIAAGATVEAGAEGVLFAHGGTAGGHSMYIQNGHLHYMHNWLAEEHQKVTFDRPIEAASTSSSLSSTRRATTHNPGVHSEPSSSTSLPSQRQTSIRGRTGTRHQLLLPPDLCHRRSSECTQSGNRTVTTSSGVIESRIDSSWDRVQEPNLPLCPGTVSQTKSGIYRSNSVASAPNQ